MLRSVEFCLVRLPSPNHLHKTFRISHHRFPLVRRRSRVRKPHTTRITPLSKEAMQAAHTPMHHSKQPPFRAQRPCERRGESWEVTTDVKHSPIRTLCCTPPPSAPCAASLHQSSTPNQTHCSTPRSGGPTKDAASSRAPPRRASGGDLLLLRAGRPVGGVRSGMWLCVCCCCARLRGPPH